MAIVFGPNLIRPKVETVQNALEMPLLHGIIQILIEQSDLIFPTNKAKKDLSRQVSHRFSPGGRPLSVLFVGKELKPLLQNEMEKELELERERLLESVQKEEISNNNSNNNHVEEHVDKRGAAKSVIFTKLKRKKINTSSN